MPLDLWRKGRMFLVGCRGVNSCCLMKTKAFLSLVSAGSLCFVQALTARGVEVEAGAAVQTSPAVAPQDQAPAPAVAPAPAAEVNASASVRLPYGVEDVLKLARNQVSDDVIVAYVQGA